MITPRTACKHCGYMTRMVDTAICTNCRDAIEQEAEFLISKDVPLHPEAVVGYLFASLEVGLEGCPAFEHLNGTQDAMLTAESWNSKIDGRISSTRYINIEGTRYSVRIQQEG